ncbi:MAG: hypothetical protein HYX97_04185 [Chloroflexi bacterium]|nr:hypothetical protein [Chloroflexota bacterium]
MRVFFDVDNTILAWDNSLRPLVREVFQRLNADGHSVFIWSGVGLRWEVVRTHQLEQYIVTCYVKPLDRYHESLTSLGITTTPDFVVDDHPGIVEAFSGYLVSPYYFTNPHDQEMLRVYEAVATRSNGTGKP